MFNVQYDEECFWMLFYSTYIFSNIEFYLPPFCFCHQMKSINFLSVNKLLLYIKHPGFQVGVYYIEIILF